MPIITGFPPSNTISPSVRIREIDLSYYTSVPTSHNAGIIGFCSKGPINKPTLITTQTQLNQIFGYPHPDVSDPYLIYAATQYLLVADQLYVVRVAETNQVSDECAATASVWIPAAGELITVVGGIPMATPSQTGWPDQDNPPSSPAAIQNGVYEYWFQTSVFANGAAYFSWSLNGQVNPNTLVIPVPSLSEINAISTPTTVTIPADAITGYPGGETVTATSSGITYNTWQLVALLNSQINPDVDGIVFNVCPLTGTNPYTTNRYTAMASLNPTGTLQVSTVWAYGPNATLQFLSVQDCAYGKWIPNINNYQPIQNSPPYTGSDYNFTGSNPGAAPTYVNVLQLATGSQNNNWATVGGYSQACISGNCCWPTSLSASCASPGSWNFSGVSSTSAGVINLQVVVSGTDNPLIDNQIQNIDLTPMLSLYGTTVTTNQICEYILSVSTGYVGGFIPFNSGGCLRLAHQYCGGNAQILVKAGCTANLYFNFDGLTKIGYDFTYVYPSSLQTSYFGILTGASITGTCPQVPENCSFQLTADSPGIEGNNTYVTIVNDTTDNVFSMTVYNQNGQLESWGGLTMDDTSSYFVGTYLALVSNYVAAVVTNTPSPPPQNGTYYLGDVALYGAASGIATPGSDGIPALPDDQDTLLAGNAINYTGLYAISDPEQVDIDIITIPGHSSTDVIESLITFCGQYRQDCMAIVDPPFGLTVNEIIAWQNGSHPLNNVRFDSDFLALYWPWVQIYDTYNQINVWIPPSGSIMAVYAYSDELAAPWFAPAGETRGIVPGIVNVFSRPTLAERDAMYGNANCINPIVQFSDSSNFVVWGQKTMQRLPTALDRVNVRRLMFYIEKQIRQASRALLFDPNDELFDKKFINMCSQILTTVETGRGIYDYMIVADSTINTPDVIDRNEFRANIGIQPEKAVEYMFLTFTINKTGDWAQPATITPTIT